MPSDAVLLNLALAGRALAGSSVYVLATGIVGLFVLRRLGWRDGFILLPVAAVTGVAAYSFVLIALSLLHVAYRWVIAALVILPLALAWRQVPTVYGALVGELRAFWLDAGPLRVWAVVTGVYLVHVVSVTIANPIGGDLGNYHLVIPRDVLWNHGFVFNPFSHEAGIPYGWSLYGVPAFLLGGDRGYVFLSFWAWLLVLALVWEVGRAWRSNKFAAELVALAAFVISGMARSYVANNDVPGLLVESVAVVLAMHRFPVAPAVQAALFGLACGLAVGIKLQLVAAVLIAAAIYAWRVARWAWRPVAVATAAAVPLALVWPAVTFVNTGSPLPQLMMALRTQGPPPPHLPDSMASLSEGFGQWYAWNFQRFFTAGMEGYSAVLAGIVVAALTAQHFRADRVVRLLVAFALARWAVLFALAPRQDILWHDRYHLISFLALGLAGAAGWHSYFLAGRSERSWRYALPVVAATAVAWQLTEPFEMYSPNPLARRGVEREVMPSILDTVAAQARSFTQAPGAGPAGGPFDWMSLRLPQDALVATTAVDPYYIQRRTIQLLPVSQDRIDLSRSPDALLAELHAFGVTHLHLTQFSGLNVWMNPKVDQWLESVRQIPRLPGVELVMRTVYPSSKGEQAIYHLTASDVVASADRGTAVAPRQVRAVVVNSTQVLLSWLTDAAGCHQLSAWDEATGRFATLGVAGPHESTFLVPNVMQGHHRFRVCQLDGGTCSAPSDVSVDVGL